MMQKLGLYSLGLVLSLAAASCYYDNEEELYPMAQGCMTDTLSFAETIVPILENNCYRCHDAATNLGNVTLEGYQAVKNYADDGRLIGVIRQDPGFSPMPQDAGPLNDCFVSQIEAWIDQGALNN